MIDIDTIIKTCDQSLAINPVRTIASYSHIIPMILSFVLGVFVFFKSKFNILSKVFLLFIIFFCIWLIGDVISWTSNKYILVYTKFIMAYTYQYFLELVYAMYIITNCFNSCATSVHNTPYHMLRACFTCKSCFI